MSSIAKDPTSPSNQARALSGSPVSSGLQPAAPPFEMPFAAGEIIAGKYEVIGLIGTGGIGYVVSATHVDLGDAVAIKFLRPEFLANEEVVRRFASEARAAVKIKSERVVRVFDIGNLPNGTPFIVMELLRGKDLSQTLRMEGRLRPEIAVEYMLQACEALATAHVVGIIHRDVKPENLFVAEQGQGLAHIKMLDFGISKIALTGSAFDLRFPLARTVAAMGSPPYMSPEQIRASQNIDARSDIWSVGCVLYELLAGKPAFDASSLMEVCAAVLEKTPTSLREHGVDTPEGLEEVVFRCLAKEPQGRYANVAELALALARFAPERAAVWVERTCHVLRASGATLSGQDPLERSEPVRAAGTRPRRVQTTLVEGTPVSTKPVSITDPEALSQAEIDALRPKTLPKKVLFFTIGFSAVAGLYALLLQTHTLDSRSPASGGRAPAAMLVAGASSSGADPAGSLMAVRSAHLETPVALDLPSKPPSANPSGSLQGSPAAASAVTDGGSERPKAAAPAPKPRKRTAVKAPPSSTEEPDIGF